MDTDEHGSGLPQAELTRILIGSAMEIINTIGHGLHEKPYENALVVELGLRGLSCDQQFRFPVLYKGRQVGEYIPDLIAAGAVIVDTKVVDKISDHDRGQMLNYLRITRLKVGLIFNFKHPRLQWERVVL
ncbi:GxxExxY protein [Opitutales bacterium ASA1]|uniref:GxxExxY protein n=1 Tax=Congregicoccus parvus TaxID=3081749 RepID=UPI002B2AAF48|nr:GxxExxY protein [Opitutales bacterium ASA1]